MDLMQISISFFTIVVTMTLGFFLIQKIFPSKNRAIEISKAFKAKDYELVIRLTEGREGDYNNSLDIYNFAAMARFKLKLYAEAIFWWELSLSKIDIQPKDRLFIDLSIGDAYLAMRDAYKAEMHYRMALSVNPNHEQANYKLALLLYNQHNFEQCRKVLRGVLKENPSLIDLRKLYAECLASLELYTKAIRHYGFLDRLKENILTYNYAKTLQKLKIWDKAHHVLELLLENTFDVGLKEEIMIDLIRVTTFMKKYPESLGLIEKFLPSIQNTEHIFEIKYIRANIFFMKGDQMIALQEFYQLDKENPKYKDIASTVQKNAQWLSYPFLFNYFTSNETILEALIMRLIPAGSTIIRRSSSYYMCMKENTVYVFYRDIRPMLEQTLYKIHITLPQYCPQIERLEVWSLQGIEGKYSITGQKYRLILHSEEEFLVNTNIAVSQMDYLEGAHPLNFVEDLKNLPEIVPIDSTEVQNIDLAVDNILLTKPIFLEDELLSKALE